MFVTNLLGPLEAVLFASGDPVTAEQLMTVLDIDEDNVEELAVALEPQGQMPRS